MSIVTAIDLRSKLGVLEFDDVGDGGGIVGGGGGESRPNSQRQSLSLDTVARAVASVPVCVVVVVVAAVIAVVDVPIAALVEVPVACPSAATAPCVCSRACPRNSEPGP